MKVSIKKRLGAFDVVCIIIVGIFTFFCLAPLLYIASVALSDELSVVSHKVTIYPIGLNFRAIITVVSDSTIQRSFVFTVFLTLLKTVISMCLTICVAYPLTKNRLKGRNIFILMIMIPMYFTGGIIPDFILEKNLKLLNTMWSLILPGAISTFNVIIMRTFFANSIPDSLEEAAQIDGCNDLRILVKIVLPLAMPVLACLSLFYAVARWNGFQDVLFYITDPDLYTLQMKLYQIVYNSQSVQELESAAVLPPTEGLRAATMVIATVPILLIYPWLQRYFTAGITIGAIKG